MQINFEVYAISNSIFYFAWSLISRNTAVELLFHISGTLLKYYDKYALNDGMK